MQIVVTGLNHRTAPVELREQFAIPEAQLGEALEVLLAQNGVSEGVILSTCNRVELYTVESASGEKQGSASFFREFFHVAEHRYINHLYRLYDAAAVRHLFNVASSLDSMIVGEPQILGQVKQAFLRAQEVRATGPILNHLFTHALAVGKRARSETAVGTQAVSVPSAAVDLARTIFDRLEGKRVVVIGRGKMSELALRHLKRENVREVIVVGRCLGHAHRFAKEVGASARPFDEALTFLDDADIVLASTRAPHMLLSAAAVRQLMRRRHNRLLLIVDISVPRVVDPAVNDLENVYLFNIDHLEEIVAENYRLRLEEARKAGALIEEETAEFLEWFNSRQVVPTIQAFREYLETVRREEVQRVLSDLSRFTPEQRELIEQFSRALVNKIAHTPTVRLKSAPDPETASQFSAALQALFDLQERQNRK
ncbi:MAG: glutamyl-tRNA reductase [Candidatus Hydrogenedentota bacterium]|jgi:glutamyl-tRNA reductase|nr:glutamyl-tRNA reductase [Candidatus Sumerlaea chitinivorans]RMH24866.1 MAG: glutamyl-tRNA reductase [Candidatus Hydrogenedentota bacterium]